ncbi:MAG: hypothetical protein ABIQ06_14945 [Caldimonas sp.]
MNHEWSRTHVLGRAALLGFALALASCGGGGGGGGGGGEGDHSFSALSTDTYPSGARVDVSSLDLLPVHNADTWTYAEVVNGVPDGAQIVRTVLNGPDANGAFSVVENGPTSSEVINYRISGAGLEELDPLGLQSVFPAIYNAFPSWFVYPTPFYAVGETRRHVRQGSIGEDLDGDGKADSFRVEMTQVFLGFESQQVFGQAAQVAHFRTTFIFTIRGSASGDQSSATAFEDAWLAPGIGMVRSDRSATSDGAVIVAPFTLQLQSATINGVTRSGNGASVRYALPHRSSAYDATRRVYYVAVSNADPRHPNSIATIQADTGAISFSAPVGLAPGALAISNDGTTLYAALDEGDVIRLSLPTMTETGRVRLPVDASFGQERAEDIAVAPGSSDVVAVSLYYSNVDPRHAGVVLLRNMVIQPQRTVGFYGSNTLAFDSTGGWLYGYNNENAESGLRRMEVLADGIVQRAVITADADRSQELSVTDGLAVVGNKVFLADSSMAFVGSVTGARNCTKLPSVSKLVCLSTVNPTQLAIFDSTTFADLGSRTFGTSSSQPFVIVPGAAGQVLLAEQPLGVITLFRDAALQ